VIQKEGSSDSAAGIVGKGISKIHLQGTMSEIFAVCGNFPGINLVLTDVYSMFFRPDRNFSFHLGKTI